LTLPGWGCILLPVENNDGVNEMSPDSGQMARPGSPLDAGGANGSSRLFSLFRHSHIFATAVREVLEIKLLREIAPCPLTALQFHLLKLLSLDGHHQVGEVAHFLGVSPPAATKNIDKLARFGLVVRSPCTGDRRATLLSASRKGRRLVREYEKLKAERMSPVLGRFDQQELDMLSGLLERFSLALLDLDQSVDRFCLRCAGYIDKDCSVGQLGGGCPYQKSREARPSGDPMEKLS
jgi:DNA-binding MarR family transcriptional regulator